VTAAVSPPPGPSGSIRAMSRPALQIALALLLAAPSASAAPKLRVVVDPGHGGKMYGASGVGGMKEAELCLELAGRVAKALERTVSAQVVLTRTEDVELSLPDRVAFANRERADLFISIHGNSMPTRRLKAQAQGIETYFLSVAASGDAARRTAERENAEGGAGTLLPSADPLAYILQDLARSEAHQDSSRLAYAVHQKIIAATGAEDRGVQQAPFFVLHGVDAPAILIEVGFISNPDEGKRLKDPKYQELMAGALAQGVKAYLEQVAGAGVRNAAR